MAEARKYAYCRVSSKDQNLARQLEAMRAEGIHQKSIYSDKQSGKNFDRPEYKRLLKRLRSGDVFFIKSIDRLGRNYAEILEQWRMLTKEKGVDIVVLDMPLLDTRRDKNLMGNFVCDIVLQVLSFVAENERTNIRQRQAEGITAAKARGVRFGRPTCALPENFEEIVTRQLRGEMSLTQAADLTNMAVSSFAYRAKKYKESVENAAD